MPFDHQRRRLIGALAGSALTLPFRVSAAPSGRICRLGVLHGGSQNQEFERFRRRLLEALAALGYREGVNLAVEWRFTDNDEARNDPMAADLVRAGVHALLSQGTPRTRALQRATSSIPIVTGVGDPVASGFARSLARPGGNITGLSYGDALIARKQVGLLREMAPKIRRLSILRLQKYGAVGELNRPLESAALELGVEAGVRIVRDQKDVETALEELAGTVTGAAFIPDDFRLELDAGRLAKSALHHRVATFAFDKGYVASGVLMSYTIYHPDELQRIASLLDSVFRGANPGEIPFELPAKSMLALNRSTASALRITLPEGLLLRADEVVG